MSLITDTLNKMKKEQGSEENDDKMMAPPALRNAVVNTKKYQEFVKNAEIKDINGNKAPLKGFVVVSIILVAVIGAVVVYFLNKENNSLIKQAGIVSDNQQVSQQPANGNAVKSLGKPYNPNAVVDKQTQPSPAANTNGKPAQVQNQQPEKAAAAQPVNNTQDKLVQPQMSSMPDSKQVSGAKAANSQPQTKQGPVNIIPANQLFLIAPTPAPANNQTEQNNTVPAQQNMQNNKPAVDKKEAVLKSQPAKNNAGAAAVSQDNLKKTNEYLQTQAVKEDNIVQNQSTPNIAVKDYADKTEIAEVKAIKTKNPVGTVSASTISLYNQYVTTGNKAKNEGSYERAIEYYTNALALNKSDILSANIANMYLELKNPNMAFQVVVRNGMTDTKLISSLAVRMINSKYFLESNKLLQYANTLDKSSYTLFASGYFAQSQQKYDEAVKFYKDAILANPADVNSAYYAALCFEEQGKNNEAVEMYKYILNSSSSSENMKKQASARVKKLGN